MNRVINDIERVDLARKEYDPLEISGFVKKSV